MAINEYVRGAVVRLTGTFTNVTGVLADPTDVTVTVRKPDNTSTPYTYSGSQVLKDSTGVYHYDQTTDQKGRWYYRVEGTGAVVAVDEGSFTVKSAF